MGKSIIDDNGIMDLRCATCSERVQNQQTKTCKPHTLSTLSITLQTCEQRQMNKDRYLQSRDTIILMIPKMIQI